jgi:CheY-like chemotaxis protein
MSGLAGTRRRARVLVVDDAPTNRGLVVALLDSLGVEAIEAADGREAVEVACRTPFDLVLMDLQMPVMDGLSAARAIRAGEGASATAPILAVSAHVDPEDVAACRAAGMNDHLPKPISAGDLLSKVTRWTGAH